eukprot:SAG31_NODE_2942_length_4878_cov_6.517263_7_plen_141_part_00
MRGTPQQLARGGARSAFAIRSEMPRPLSSSQPVWVGVDLGGTNAKAAAVSDDGTVLASRIIPHNGDLAAESVICRLVECIEAALHTAGVPWSAVEAVGVGSPGSIEDGTVVAASNFPQWHVFLLIFFFYFFVFLLIFYFY